MTLLHITSNYLEETYYKVVVINEKGLDILSVFNTRDEREADGEVGRIMTVNRDYTYRKVN